MSTGLQVVLYTAGAAIVALAIVLMNVLLSLRKQLDRVVAALEHAEAEITPMQGLRIVPGIPSDPCLFSLILINKPA